MEFYSVMKIDETDLKILGILKENAKMTTSKISKIIRIPVTTIHNRIKKLQNEGVIKNYTINLDHKKLGKHLYAIILINTRYVLIKDEDKNRESVAKTIKKLDGVEEVCRVTGINDFLVRVRKENIDELNNFLIDKLRKVSGVEKTQTLIVLNND